MKRNTRVASVGANVVDQTGAAIELMQHYCDAHPGSPAAVRRPRLFIRSGVWVALLGPSVEQGIVGIGQTVESALRAFDVRYQVGLRPSPETRNRRRSSSKKSGPDYPHFQA